MTTLPDMDFETYSEAGMYRTADNKWRPISTGKSGIGCVGASVYSEHPTTEIICLAYDLKQGNGKQLWVPGMPNPADLLDHISTGGLIEAHNSGFEYLIWNNVGCRLHGWPELPLSQLRCSAAKAKAHALPASLAGAGAAIGLPADKLKDKEGKRLIKKFSIPQTPTKKQPKERLTIYDDPIDGQKFYQYCVQDIVTEDALSTRLPELDESELPMWLIDQGINMRGVQVDMDSVENCIAIVEQAFAKYNAELRVLTGGLVTEASKRDALMAFTASQGVTLPNMQAETIEAILPTLTEGPARRALEIRSLIGSAAVKKLFAMRNMTSRDGRLRELFSYHQAHTGRFAGKGPQPQNLPNSGPSVRQCDGWYDTETMSPEVPCGAYFEASLGACPRCAPRGTTSDRQEWSVEAAEFTLSLAANRNLAQFESYFLDPIGAVSGCLRALFTVKPGCELICSDYSAIEAVVLACLAGEKWRVDVFKDHGKIYEMSASKISGIPFQEFLDHKTRTGDNHPLRKKLGKVAELASGYGGGLGAWKQFGADKFMSDEEIEQAKKAWRKESPAIVKLWANLERSAKRAIQFAGTTFECRGLYLTVKDDILWLRLLSGRFMKYHQPKLTPTKTQYGDGMSITFMGVDSKTKQWCRKGTYGGRLTENVTQAIARDIFCHGMKNVDAAGYPIVLHTHDEMISEVPIGYGSVEEYERLMTDCPDWCSDWPIRADGGWRGKRYRKD